MAIETTPRHPGLSNGPIYLDYNATTPVDPRVVEAALPYLTEHFRQPIEHPPCNPSLNWPGSPTTTVRCSTPMPPRPRARSRST